jgi:hypothetical protein
MEAAEKRNDLVINEDRRVIKDLWALRHTVVE